MLAHVAAALAAIEARGTFATELSSGSEDLHIHVTGVGPLHFPLSAATTKALCAISRAAPFGRGAQTLHDVRVRDTMEIGRSRIKIDAPTWRRALAPKLAIIATRLGLPEGGRLDAKLDKLLIYGPGQFFAPHQDSERADDMVGSLVVVLPCEHTGGHLVVTHDGERKTLRSAARGPKNLSLLAFYADCLHEVKPVDSGYRITLTYHLHYRQGEPDRGLPHSVVEPLATSVSAYFATPVGRSYPADAPKELPDRLVYLLDHEYTQKSLAWVRLKNADRLRALALKEVAERLACEAFLALADVHESWGSEDEGWGRERYGRRRWGGEDDEAVATGVARDPALVDLIDSSVELNHWVDREGRPSPGMSASPQSDEICFTRPSVETVPFKSEHEGYMGNYGNTVDRWYHRAAVVMWPRARNFVIRAKVSPAWAIKEIASQLKAGRSGEARAMARALLPFWERRAGDESSATFVPRLLKILLSLEDAELAFRLISPFGPHRLNLRTTPAFVALVELHGRAWAERVFRVWAKRARYDTPPWLTFLPRLCQALVIGGPEGEALAPWLLTREATSFKKRLEDMRRAPRFAEEASYRDEGDLLALLETAAMIQAPSIREDLITSLTRPRSAWPFLHAASLLKRCRDAHTPKETRALELRRLYDHVVASLEEVLAAPTRRADDWSIEPPAGCSCALCKELSAFLRARDRVQHEWPLANERRRHVHGRIDSFRLPVTHVTIPRGSPHTLVLTKQPALFERAAARRARQTEWLRWLAKERRVFAHESTEA